MNAKDLTLDDALLAAENPRSACDWAHRLLAAEVRRLRRNLEASDDEIAKERATLARVEALATEWRSTWAAKDKCDACSPCADELEAALEDQP